MITDIKRHSIAPSDKYIFDTNIWLFIHCPIGNHNSRSVSNYAEFYKRLNAAKAPIFISSHIVSEFINAYARIDFNLLREHDSAIQSFKRDYRSTKQYEQTMSTISHELESKILKRTLKLTGNLSIKDICGILEQKPAIDFNDAVLVEKVRSKDIKIVTDDIDFARYKADFDILTSNPKLIAS